jgi:hypothetical protein
MTPQPSMARRNRRSFLKSLGAGALAIAGGASPTPLPRSSWAAAHTKNWCPPGMPSTSWTRM